MEDRETAQMRKYWGK